MAYSTDDDDVDQMECLHKNLVTPREQISSFSFSRVSSAAFLFLHHGKRRLCFELSV